MKIVMIVALALALSTGCEKPADVIPGETRARDGVEVLSIGNEPTRLLRYRLTKGATSPLELAMELDLDGAGRSSKLPALVLSLSIHVEDVLADGTALIKTTVESARVEDRPGAIPSSTVGSMTQMLTGLAYAARLSPDGRLRDTRIVTANGQTMQRELAQFTQGLEQVALALPAMPVGVGSKWTNRKQSTQNGVAMTTVTTIEITAIDGDKLSFASSSTVSAPDQTVQQGGISARITDIGGGGTGKGIVDLSKMTLTGELSAEFRGTMAAQGSGGKLRVAMKMTMR